MKKLSVFIALVWIAFISSYFTAAAQWGPPIPFPAADRDGAASFTINGKGYVASGLFSNDTWEFNPAGEVWTQKANLNGNQTIIFSASFSINNKGYMVCGDSAFGSSINAVREYDPVADVWTPKANFPGGSRVGQAAWVANGRVFVGGGADYLNGSGVGPCHNDFYEYLPQTDTWNSIGNLPVNIAFASCFVINDTCYFTMGNKSNAIYSNELWAYNIVTNSWSQKANCTGAPRSLGVGFSIDGKGYAGLGQSLFSNQYSDFYEYNPATNSWLAIDNYPNNLSSGSAAFVVNDTAFVGTGIHIVTFDGNLNLYRYPSNSATTINKIGRAENSVSIYPNPAIDVLNFSFSMPSSHNVSVKIYDISGRLMRTSIIPNQPVFQLDIGWLEPGIFLCELENGDQKQRVLFNKIN